MELYVTCSRHCFSRSNFVFYTNKKSLKIPKGNQNPYIEEKQTTQWPEEKVRKDKQRSTKHTYTTKDQVTRTRLKVGGELRCKTSRHNYN